MGQTLDFDRFLAEREKQYITVCVYGKEYRVKREIPAIVPIMLARAGEDGGAELAGRALLQASEMMIGREAVDAFCRQGMSADELGALIERTFALITGGETESAAEVLEDDGTKRSGDRAKK